MLSVNDQLACDYQNRSAMLLHSYQKFYESFEKIKFTSSNPLMNSCLVTGVKECLDLHFFCYEVE